MDAQCYTITHGKGGNAVLVCSQCDCRVRTKDFDHRRGNVRTQAASAMIAHQVEHRRPALDWAVQSAGNERVWSIRR